MARLPSVNKYSKYSIWSNRFKIRNKDSVGLHEIKRIFEEYLDEAYIGDNDIVDYINEFDKDQDGILF